MPPRITPPFQFFIDECLGRSVSDAVAAALELDEEVRVLADHFERGTKDEVWLRDVGQRGWVVLTMDSRLRHRPNERVALISASVAAFMVKAARGGVMAERVARALPQVRTALRSSNVPLVGTITDSGAVNLLIVGGKDKKRTIKPHAGGGR